MNRKHLLPYVRLLVQRGLHLDPGQDVVVNAAVDQSAFVELVVAECYRQGARKVWLDWRCQPLEVLDNRHGTVETLAKLERWQLAKFAWRRDKLPAMLYLLSDDPDGLRGIDQAKRAAARRRSYPRIKPYVDAMENRHQWCVAAVAGRAWARKVFPDLSPSRAVESLWEAILAASRSDSGDPVARWEEHDRALKARCEILNRHRFDRLLYRGDNGTRLTVGLMSKGLFLGGTETDLSGRTFDPNIPSEEVFTTPKAGHAEGLAVATRPLSWNGELIEDFSVRFEDGRAVEVKARRGQKLLEELIRMDEGAAMLGECALIPCDSPIHRSGLLFYETLFDENAACHLALGRGFNNCYEGYEELSQAALRELGVNDSMVHVDFMIGYEGLNVFGMSDRGKARLVPIFKDGEWAGEFAG